METIKAVIELKLKAILRFTKELERAVAVSPEKFEEDFLHTRAAERDLELLVELTADTLAQVFAAWSIPPIASYRDAFNRAVQEKIVDAELGRSLIRLTSLRNRLVHEYDEKFDPRRAYEGLRSAPEVFRKFCEVVSKLNLNE